MTPNKRILIGKIKDYSTAISEMCVDLLIVEKDKEEQYQIEAFIRTDTAVLQSFVEELK